MGNQSIESFAPEEQYKEKKQLRSFYRELFYFRGRLLISAKTIQKLIKSTECSDPVCNDSCSRLFCSR